MIPLERENDVPKPPLQIAVQARKIVYPDAVVDGHPLHSLNIVIVRKGLSRDCGADGHQIETGSHADSHMPDLQIERRIGVCIRRRSDQALPVCTKNIFPQMMQHAVVPERQAYLAERLYFPEKVVKR